MHYWKPIALFLTVCQGRGSALHRNTNKPDKFVCEQLTHFKHKIQSVALNPNDDTHYLGISGPVAYPCFRPSLHKYHSSCPGWLWDLDILRKYSAYTTSQLKGTHCCWVLNHAVRRSTMLVNVPCFPPIFTILWGREQGPFNPHWPEPASPSQLGSITSLLSSKHRGMSEGHKDTYDTRQGYSWGCSNR